MQEEKDNMKMIEAPSQGVPVAERKEDDMDADNKPLKYKIIALLCTLLLSVGSHFASQAFSASKTPMKTHLDISNANYGALQSSVALVNTFMPLIGGLFMDRFGTATGSIICTSMILLGNIIEAVAARVELYWLMAVGRAVFG
jgi:MFS family permease